MKFKMLVESEMITELSQDGKWVTFKNGQHTYIGKDGDIETGTLKGYNVNNKKAIKGKYKQLQDQAAKKKKQEEKAKKREESKLTDFQRKNADDMLDSFANKARWEEYSAEGRQKNYDKSRKGYADKLKAKKEAGQLNKDVATDKQWDTYMNRIAHYGEKGNSEKSQRKQKRKQLTRDYARNTELLMNKLASKDKDVLNSRVKQDLIRQARQERQKSKES